MAKNLHIRSFRPRDQQPALNRLLRHARENLLIIDAIRRINEFPIEGEVRPEILIVEEDERIVGIALLQPIIALDYETDIGIAYALRFYVAEVNSGLIKTRPDVADVWWRNIAPMGRNATIDRFEQLYGVTADRARLTELPEGLVAGWAGRRDLADLIYVARQSLREEDRLDPFEANPRGFRRWVAARLHRALILTSASGVCFVAYADIRWPEGWLLQGVFTPDAYRRQGYAAAGVSALCRQAFNEGAGHVQLAVVSGNTAAELLYRQLGFECFGQFRTILFS